MSVLQKFLGKNTERRIPVCLKTICLLCQSITKLCEQVVFFVFTLYILKNINLMLSFTNHTELCEHPSYPYQKVSQKAIFVYGTWLVFTCMDGDVE